MEEKELMKGVCISKGNAKLGHIPSVSFPAIVTCRACACHKICYAKRIANLRNTVLSSYERNYAIYQERPDIFWKSVELAIAMTTVFRFFVSGDIPDKNFLDEMIKVVKKNEHCKVLCFTKRYEWVNEWIEENGSLPDNLQIIFSAWKGLQMSNPFLLPECHVIYSDGTTTADTNKLSYYCDGNCTNCKVENKGCWALKKNQQVLIKQH